MANDRVYIVCNCAEKVLLLKYFPMSGSYVYHADNTVGDFMHEHLASCGEADSKIHRLPFQLRTEDQV